MRNFIKPIYYIPAIIVLCFVVILTLIVPKIGKHAQACGNVQINNSTTVFEDFTGPYIIGFSVWRDTCTGDEYASARNRNSSNGSVPQLIVTIIRNDGGDFRQQTCNNLPVGGTCITAKMPLNGHTAYAKVQSTEGMTGLGAWTSSF